MSSSFPRHTETEGKAELTSFRVIGFSSRVKCVSFVKFCSGARSASSDMLFEVKTRVVKFGRDEARVDWM
jgi:hypothetical protein